MIGKLGVIDQNNYDMVLKEYKEKFGVDSLVHEYNQIYELLADCPLHTD